MRRAALCGFAILALPAAAHAQRSSENAVTSADDAFGSSVGLETTGIYSEFDTRGFSPQKAGNARIDGIYYDPVGALSGRLKQGQTIRVGFAAEEYPFQAPTGIVDYGFRPFPVKSGLSVTYQFAAYGGYGREVDVYLPSKDRRFALTGGVAMAEYRNTDGAYNAGTGVTLRPMARLGGVEVAPFASLTWADRSIAHPLVTVSGDYLPKQPARRRYLGQTWAKGKSIMFHFGGTVKASLTDRLSLRAGLFRSLGDRDRNFTELFSIVDPSGLASHRLIADPHQQIRANSGEAQVAWRMAGGKWQHRIIAGFRARDRITETGGSVLRNYVRPANDPLIYGQFDPQPKEDFAPSFGPVNRGQVRQSAFLLGYTGKLAGVGMLNLGLQKARYRATSRDGRTGAITRSQDDPWLYNATLGIDLSPALSLYGGTQKGLEDSGTAPENAANRNEQLPATRSTQYEAGLRWKFPGGQLAVNAFQITKPYFSFDQTGLFDRVGTVRHRGVEASLSGHFGKRFNLLAGLVAIKARVSGPLVDQRRLGERPAGTPSLYARIDANYRTDLLGGLTPIAGFTYTGARALGARPLDTLGGKQLTVPGFATVDLGVRHRFKLGRVPFSARAMVQNVLDTKSWKVVAANTLFPEERRRFSLTLLADF